MVGALLGWLEQGLCWMRKAPAAPASPSSSTPCLRKNEGSRGVSLGGKIAQSRRPVAQHLHVFFARRHKTTPLQVAGPHIQTRFGAFGPPPLGYRSRHTNTRTQSETSREGWRQRRGWRWWRWPWPAWPGECGGAHTVAASRPRPAGPMAQTSGRLPIARCTAGPWGAGLVMRPAATRRGPVPPAVSAVLWGQPLLVVSWPRGDPTSSSFVGEHATSLPAASEHAAILGLHALPAPSPLPLTVPHPPARPLSLHTPAHNVPPPPLAAAG